MRIARLAIGLAGALLMGLGSAAAQGGGESPSGHARSEPKEGRGIDKTAVEKARAAVAATPATPATPATRGGPDGPATPATPATPAVPAAPLVPPGLSGHAPDTAPNVGVIGGGGGKGGSSAATPEPSTLMLMGVALAGVYGLRRFRR